MRTLTTVLLLSLIALVGCSGGEEAPAAEAATVEADAMAEAEDAPVGRIAFISDYEGSDNIYLVDADGGNLIPLTTTSGGFPAWSPDGSRIALQFCDAGECDLFVIDADGGNCTRLTSIGGWCHDIVWSSDGSRIAFTFWRSGYHEVFVIDADGGNLTQLSLNAGTSHRPDWSPDGSRITFVADPGDGVRGEIFVVEIRSGNQTQLTTTGGDYPAWSPDGSRIAFTSWGNEGYEVFVMDVDGSNRTQLTFNDRWNSNIVWSLDGSRIAFDSSLDGSWDTEIFVMDADGGNLTQLTSNARGNESPSWNPDGHHIAYIRKRDKGICVVGIDGRNDIQLTTYDSWISEITWCPVNTSSPATSPTIPAPAVHLRVIVDSLRLRDEPNTGSGEKVGLLEKGDTVEVLWRWKNWAKVRTESDLDAWACVELDGETFLAPAE